MSEVSRGSTWRRWDPHVHLPGTVLNDNFGVTTIAQALDQLAATTPAIEVLGVTDYYVADSYRRAAAAWEGGSGSSIAYLFPNIELRLDIPTAKGSGVNLHLIAAAEHVDALERFVARLEYTWKDHPYRATRSDLIRLGRDFRNDPGLAETAALTEGVNQFKVSFDAFQRVYKTDGWAQQHCLVGVAGGLSDGTSGVRTQDGAFVTQRQSIERAAHVIFSSSEQQLRFWRGEGADSPEKLLEVYGGRKLCLHGSDAHNASKLGRPDRDRYTWIKGDPTFDGLRMACLAPQTRLSIGSLNPGLGAQGRIASVTVDGAAWFSPATVPLNPGLVAIIGPRGSGKTALADLIAAGAGSARPLENPASFVRRAGALLDGYGTKVSWTDGQTSEVSLSQRGGAEPRVRYLSQQFVEQLCAADGVSDELLSEIERVIFDSWPVEQRQGSTSFRELLDIRLSSARRMQQAELETLAQVSAAITEQRVLMNSLPDKKAMHQSQATQLGVVRGQIKELTDHAGGQSAARHALVSEVLTRRLSDLQAVDRRRTALRSLAATSKQLHETRFPQLLAQLREQHSQAGLSEDEWQAFLPTFTGDPAAVSTAKIAEADAAYASLLGTAEPVRASLDGLDEAQLEQVTVSALKAEQERLQKLVGLDDQRTKQLAKLQGQLSLGEAAHKRLAEEIVEAENADAKAVQLGQQRVAHYAAYFNALLNEEAELEGLYEPLARLLAGAGKSVAKLRLAVLRKIDLDAWVSEGESLIDLRLAGTFKGAGEMKRIAAVELLPAWREGDGEVATEAIGDFSAKYSHALRSQSRVSRDDETAYRDWERRTARWLYSVRHIRVTYSLEFDGVEVERLSPGSRGIVLLLLYLAVDQSETDPLIIDQPEENLDPESVYAELVDLFRNASARRQIIMVTHNANLVVNTDVDQVVVAHAGNLERGKLPKLQYTAGGLERADVRAAVCNILEGGANAFRERARRLRIEAATALDVAP